MKQKIVMKRPIVEMQGDEMTRIIWDWIKDILLTPYIELNTEFYDLSLVNRDNTKDEVTVKAAEAIKRLGVGVKCATITPNAQRVKEYNLKNLLPSPNATIRAILDGTVFRAPVLVKGVKCSVSNWKKPIIIARHAYGDVYKGVEAKIPKNYSAEIVVFDENGDEFERLPIQVFSDGDGIVQGMHNTDKSIESFARACFNYSLDVRQNLWFGTKDTISKIYDHRFKDIFNEVFERDYADLFKKLGLNYEYSLIDDTMSRVIKSEGGFVLALKNYDGDVMSDLIATAYGSLAMMTSVLVSPDGKFEFEAAHGTVTRHFYKHNNGEPTSTNSVATIFAWTGALQKSGELENNVPLINFAKKLEKATVQTIENGIMTGDLSSLFSSNTVKVKKVFTVEFLEEVGKTFAAMK